MENIKDTLNRFTNRQVISQLRQNAIPISIDYEGYDLKAHKGTFTEVGFWALDFRELDQS